MVDDPKNTTEGERRQAYLRCVCATLNFDVGEIWSFRSEEYSSDSRPGEGPRESSDDDEDGSNGGPMRFIQLYTSPSFRNQRSKLVTPSEDWEQSHTDVSKHKFSPLICEAVRDGGGVVWANTEVQEGLLGRSDLPLRTAVGAPVYTQGEELGVLVLFSPSLIQISSSTMEFLYTLAQAASSADTTDAFLPALASSFPVRPPSPPAPPAVALRSSASWRQGSARNRMRRLDELRASLPVDVMFQTLAMGQAPNPERSLRAVRSVYNQHNGSRVVIGAGGTIPAEFFRPGGGGLVVARKHGTRGFVASGALTTSDLNTRGGRAAGANGGNANNRNNSDAKRPVSPLTLGEGRAAWGSGGTGGATVLAEDGGGARGGGGGASGSASYAGRLALLGDEGGNDCGGGGASAQAPMRRSSFQANAPVEPQRLGSFHSNSSVDLGFSLSGDELSVLDSDEYNLWSAFMKTDSAPNSPCPSPCPPEGLSTGMSAQDKEGGRDDGVGGAPAKGCRHSASFQTLSELLSSNASPVNLCDDSGDENDNVVQRTMGLPHQAQSEATAAGTASLSGLRQGFAGVDNSLLKQEFDQNGEAVPVVSAATTGSSSATTATRGGGGTQMQSFPLLPEDQVVSSFSSSPATGVVTSTTATMTSAALATGNSSGLSSTSGGSGGGQRSSSLLATTTKDVSDKATAGAAPTVHHASTDGKGVAVATVERRGFVEDECKRNRLDEFITGVLSMSLFQAADVWLPLTSSSGNGNHSSGDGGDKPQLQHKKVSRLFVFSSNVQDPALSKWSSLSRNVVLASGVGLPGIVFQERRPQWAVDYSQVDSERNPLASVARLLGIGSAFGIPLSIGGDECGVLMLYSMSCLPPSELMVEFVEKAARLLLADAPAPVELVEQFRENPPSAKDIGRVAGAYQHHALWAEHQARSNTITATTNNGGNASSSGIKRRVGGGTGIGSAQGTVVRSPFPQHAASSGGASSSRSKSSGNARPPPELPASQAENLPTGPAGWCGGEAALAVAAAATASGGQGGGFRSDGGAVAFVPPPDWSGNEAQPPAFMFNRVDLDSRPPILDKRGPAAAAVSQGLASVGRSGGTLGALPTKDSGGGVGVRRGVGVGRLFSSEAAAAAVAKTAIPEIAKVKPKPRKSSVAASAPAPAVTPAKRTLAQGTAVTESSKVDETAKVSKGGGAGGAGGGAGAGGRKAVTSSSRGSRASTSTSTSSSASSPTVSSEKSKSGGMPPPTVSCRAPGCIKTPNGRTPFCWDHWSAARQCQHEGCDKLSQGNTRLCIAHGGGRRCTHPGCNKGARDRFFCAAHGGGKRCGVPDCGKAAVGGSDLCTGHGGGKRCQFPNCPKSAQSKTNFCVRHGGGRKCSIAGCLKVARGRTSHCAAHGGGVRCCIESCNKAAVGRERMCRSHQRRSKNAAAAAAAAASATGSGGPPAVPISKTASRTGSSLPAANSSTALSVLSAAAATHGVNEFLEPAAAAAAAAATIGSGGGVATSLMMPQAPRQHPVSSSAAATAALAATSTAVSAIRAPLGSTGARRWTVSVEVGGGVGGRDMIGQGRKRTAAVAMVGGGPADNMGALRGGSGGQRSFHLTSPFPPSNPAI